jgi:hypothetical protein
VRESAPLDGGDGRREHPIGAGSPQTQKRSTTNASDREARKPCHLLKLPMPMQGLPRCLEFVLQVARSEVDYAAMELVFLQDVQGGYASNWARIANTEGVKDIKIGDRFREQGFGPGAEELEVAGVDISPIGGASRLFFNRAANATQPEVHRLGAVFFPVFLKATMTSDIEIVVVSNPLSEYEIKPGGSRVTAEIVNGTDAVNVTGPEPALVTKRGRGRPAGSKNKAKDEVAFPAGF